MFIEPKGLVVHSKTSDNAQADLSRDFSLVLPKEISIVVNEETVFRGFQMTADIFSHAALFIIGSAALLSRDYKLALEIHGVCRNLVATAQTLPTAQYIARKVKDCIFVENFLLARSAYYLNQINDSVPYMTVALEMQPAFYEVLLLSGAILFKRGEYKQALEIIKRAKKHSGSRTEWMFSICFLYLWFENYDEAVKICKKIQKLNKDPIINIVDDVIRFNTILRTEGRANTQSYFWTGFLEYKVKGNIPTAFSDLTQFKNQSTEAMLPLITLADNWLGEMKEVMSIE